MIAAQNRFLKQLPVEEIAANVTEQSGHDLDKVKTLLETFSNESKVTLELIIADIDSDKRMLEVGAGLCLTSLFLKQQGFNIVALEPALGGFGIFEDLKRCILEQYSELLLEVITEPAQALNSEKHGSYDLIFSNYVIEHIPEWQDALSAMASLLTPAGKMIHSAPNYSIPYEPHYGVPVFRHFPNLSRKLFLSAHSDPEIWESLNFITCSDVDRFCSDKKLECNFRKELLYLSFKRINDDPIFKDRHEGIVAKVASLIMKSGLGTLLRYIPPTLATPMVMEITLPSRKID